MDICEFICAYVYIFLYTCVHAYMPICTGTDKGVHVVSFVGGGYKEAELMWLMVGVPGLPAMSPHESGDTLWDRAGQW